MRTKQTPPADLALLRLTNRVDRRSGRLDASAVRAAVSEALAKGQVNLAVDLSPVTTLDAAALGELASAFGRLKRLGGGLVLLGPQRRVQRLLEITRLDSLMLGVQTGQPQLAGEGEASREISDAAPWPMFGMC